jgi:ribonucleotide reductase alpha subunit
MKIKPFSNLASVVYKRTYARKDNGKLENWEDTVDRIIRGNVSNHNVGKKEIERLRYFLLNRKCGPAGRGFWFSGSPGQTKLGGVALNNCWALTADDWMNFVIAQDLLMLGGGVGVSIEKMFVSKLPKIKKDVEIIHKPSNDADFIVPDSREGWCELTRRTLESFFVTGKGFSYSTVCIRGQGELIKGFGGQASGPIPLIECINKLSSIFKKREGKYLHPIDAMDVICSIGEMVVSGNVRRSAIIIVGDANDKEYLTSKRWDLGAVPNQRAMANLSVVCEDIDDLHPLFWATYEAGEPFGIVNRKAIRTYGRMGERKKDTAVCVNPCQPAWAPVLTPDGIKTLGEVSIGDEIWSGNKWTKIVKKWSTGIKPVFAYKTRAGIFYGTENHNVFSFGERVEAKEAETIDIARGPNVNSEINLNNQDVVDGLIFGDGYYEAKIKTNFLIIGAKDQEWHSIIQGVKAPGGYCHDQAWKVETTIKDPLPKTYERAIPERFIKGDSAKICGFLKGLYSANGSITGSNRVTLKAASFKVIASVQQMLSSIGIVSYYTVNKPNEVEFSNGTYTCRESYDLNISTDRLKFRNLIGFIQNYKQERLNAICDGFEPNYNRSKNTYEIVETVKLSEEEVFDITVDCQEHCYWTGGLLVSNCAEATLEDCEPCNLQEIALPNLDSEEEFEEAARLMHRWGKRVTMEKYHIPKADEVVKRNRRIGTGITGCLQSDLFLPYTLDKVYAAIQDENVKYSKELGIPESIRTTVVKPSGTISKVFDMSGYEGIHAAYSRYIIQRVRFAATDPLVNLLVEAGHHIEPVIKFDGSYDTNTVVVDFYEQAPDGAPVSDENWHLWNQLETLRIAQKHWADQSVSVTIYYKKEQIPEIKKWLADNLKNVKTISFLCHSDHGFKQAPKEAISKEEFEELSGRIKPLDVSKMGEEAPDLDGLECQGGYCPVK